jgi:EAL domain-containing protein (putative c-di-GMP-specific phosphodiesterase class I)
MQVLTSVGLAPERLEIEVTEKLLLEPSASKQISALRSMGVGVALDDFGVGYSALGVLSQHQFSKIKLDNSFFRAPSQPVSAAMIKIVLSLGHALSVPVVAEGVQSQADCQALREHGCAAVQGFLISKPLSPTRLLQLVHSQSADATGAPHCEE